jgi:Pectate lyase superfamily protein
MPTKYLHVIFVLIAFISTINNVQAQTEFVGPFKSWANIKERFGAKGDGKADDTRAFQMALDSLSVRAKAYNVSDRAYSTIYVPAGTYNISSTLYLRGKIGAAMVGEHPASTVINWVGGDGGIILLCNGSAYYKISRFTFNGNNKKGMEGIGIHWRERWNTPTSQSFASLNIEISDNIFVGQMEKGIGGGTTGGAGTNNNDSEIAIRRCVFDNCTSAGVDIIGYNALDYWIWDSKFIRCYKGINSAYGNFHAYRCYFIGSVISDVLQTSGYYTSVRGCFSEKSRAFVLDEGFSTNPFKRIVQQNVVLKPSSIPVQYYHMGRYTAFDNVFDQSNDTSFKSFFKIRGGIFSIGNKFRNAEPFIFTADPPNKLNSVKDLRSFKIETKSDKFLKQMDQMPLAVRRKIYEVPVGATSKDIQRVIDRVSAQAKEKALIHFPFGKYELTEPLIIPGGLDLLLVGDGNLDASMILAGSKLKKDQPLVKFTGLGHVVMAELQIGTFEGTAKDGVGLEFNNIDRPESQVFIDQLYSSSKTSLLADQLDYLYIQKDNSFFSDGNVLTGGSLTAKGKGTFALYCFGGQYAGIQLKNFAKAVFKDCWWEGDNRIPIKLQGSGRLTIDGAMIAPNNVDSNTTIAIGKFSGNLSLLNMYLQGGIMVAPENSDLNILLWNIHFYHVMSPLKFLNESTNFKTAALGISTQCFDPKVPRCNEIVDVADRLQLVDDKQKFETALVEDDRKAMPRKYLPRSPSSSYLQISRVAIGNFQTGLSFKK